MLRLFLDLRERFGLTYLFISHDLAVVRLMSQRIAVMYLGRVVELGATEQVFTAPRHPYTQSLLAAVPVAGGRRVSADFSLEGEPPNPANKPSGCAFRTRCKRADTMRRRGTAITNACGRRSGGMSFRGVIPYGDARSSDLPRGVVRQMRSRIAQPPPDHRRLIRRQRDR